MPLREQLNLKEEEVGPLVAALRQLGVNEAAVPI